MIPTKYWRDPSDTNPNKIILLTRVSGFGDLVGIDYGSAVLGGSF